ncbi:MAG: PorV/PorQ family protein [Ignavibacteria bacterium]|nr:PorV/PorQ family protein [Ignavibacteria bacterium]
MKRIVNLVPIVLVLAGVLGHSAAGQVKLAQTGMKFLSVGTDARASALGDAYTAMDGNAGSLFYNPAGMARQVSLVSVGLGQTQWIADINHNYISAAFAPWRGEYGVIGVMAQTVDYGELQGTIRSDNEQGYIDMGNFTPRGTMIGIGYARALNDKFSVGGSAKWVRQNLGPAAIGVTPGGLELSSNVTSVVAFDFGIMYRTGFESLTFGMAVRNFSKEAQFQSEGFQLPLTFRIGMSLNVIDVLPLDGEMHSFMFAVDAEHPRDFKEQIKIGGEYTFMKILSLRLGYVTPADEHGVSYGVGLQKDLTGVGLGVDYAYVPFGVFGNVHRFSFQFWL